MYVQKTILSQHVPEKVSKAVVLATHAHGLRQPVFKGLASSV